MRRSSGLQNQRQSWLSGLILGTALLLPSESSADFQLNDWQLHRRERGEWSLSGSSRFFSSTKNRDGTGNSASVAGLESYKRTALNLEAQWGLHSRLTLYGRLNWLANQIRSTTITGNRYGFADQSAGLSLRLIESSVALDLQAQLDLPAYSNVNDATTGLPFLGDSSTDVTVGGFLTAPLYQSPVRDWKAIGGAGYTLRSADFSAAVPWSFEIRSQPRVAQGVILTLGAAGIQSLKTDPRGQVALTTAQFANSGGSFIVNAINPSYATARFEAGYRFESGTTLSLGYRKQLAGQSVAQGDIFDAGLQLRFPSQNAPRPANAASKKTRTKTPSLTQYVSEGKVTGVVNTRTLMIDLGGEQGISVGDLIDIFSVLPDGSLGQPVARGQVVHTEWNRAQVNLLETYQETAIKEGFLARKPIAL